MGLPSWHDEHRDAYMALIQRVAGTKPDIARAVAAAYPKGAGLAYASQPELASLGLSKAQAKRLHGAFELSRFVDAEVHRRQLKVRRPEDVERYLGAHMRHLDEEVFLLLLLDGRLRVIDTRELARGGLGSVDAHPREVFREAVRLRAHAIIMAHNHPSGSAEPSPEDISLTHRLVDTGAMLGIPVVDHLIVGRGPQGEIQVTSLAAMGLI